MELRSRPKHDRFLPDGAYLAVQESLRRLPAAGRPVVVVYAFDRLTVMLPYMFANRWMAPAGARAIGAALAAGGFEPVRIVLQQWTPNFDVRCARLDGRPVQMLCISSMQIHSARAIALVQQAHQMGPDRPLIVVGGPKAIYEPHAFFALPPGGSVEADVVVMGEEFVLLQMLERILACTGRSETLRQGF
ncbi:MAG: radical SAM protein, partial [Phycisphaerae bacterium]